MTVRRQTKELVDARESEVISAIRGVLSKHPYRATVEYRSESRFVTCVKPRWSLLGTELVVTIRPCLSLSGRTLVSAATRSQWFILGDEHGYYDDYLTSLMRELTAVLGARVSAEPA